MLLGREQAGVVTRRQLLSSGVTEGQIRAKLVAGYWQAVHPGVYATFSGPLPPTAAVWAAVLRAGCGAAAGPHTTLWLARAVDRPPARLDVVVPAGRHVVLGETLRVLRRTNLPQTVHPVARPPRLRLEVAVLDVSGTSCRAEDVADLVVRVVQRRLSTAGRLAEELALRRGHRWRGLLAEVLADVERGVCSALERRWLRDVERAHGLPAAVLNRREDTGPGREYRDAEYVEFGVVIEMDGREAHPVEEAFRDRRRDNRVAVSGRQSLRYGWHEILQDPCGVAGEVALILRASGWKGSPHPCSPTCRLGNGDHQ